MCFGVEVSLPQCQPASVDRRLDPVKTRPLRRCQLRQLLPVPLEIPVVMVGGGQLCPGPAIAPGISPRLEAGNDDDERDPERKRGNRGNEDLRQDIVGHGKSDADTGEGRQAECHREARCDTHSALPKARHPLAQGRIGGSHVHERIMGRSARVSRKVRLNGWKRHSDEAHRPVQPSADAIAGKRQASRRVSCNSSALTALGWLCETEFASAAKGWKKATRSINEGMRIHEPRCSRQQGSKAVRD